MEVEGGILNHLRYGPMSNYCLRVCLETLKLGYKSISSCHKSALLFALVASQIYKCGKIICFKTLLM